MPKIKKNVASLLELFPETRSNDTRLIRYYWAMVDKANLTNVHEDDFYAAASKPASIIRARQLLQADGLYLPDPGTQSKRRERADSMRKSISSYNNIID